MINLHATTSSVVDFCVQYAACVGVILLLIVAVLAGNRLVFEIFVNS